MLLTNYSPPVGHLSQNFTRWGGQPKSKVEGYHIRGSEVTRRALTTISGVFDIWIRSSLADDVTREQ